MNIKIQLRHAGLAALVAAAGCADAGTSIPEATQTTAEAVYVTPLPSLSFPTFAAQVPGGVPRPVIAVGRDFIYETNTGNLLAYKRKVDANGSIDGTVLPTNPSWSQSYANIFVGQTAQYDNSIASINSQYAGQNVQKFVTPCSVTNTTFCANGWYDGDTVYDEYTGRFFVMTKVRRPVWSCADSNINLPIPPGFTAGWSDGIRDSTGALVNPCNGAPPGYVQAVASRPIMVAVSQCNAQGTGCEDPANWWQIYTLADDSWDWAQINVSRGLVMVNYRVGYDPSMFPGIGDASSKIWGYSAQSLADGSLWPNYLPTPGFTLDPSNFPTTGKNQDNNPVTMTDRPNQNIFMFTEMHGATSSDWPMLVTMHGNQVWAYSVVPTDPGFLAAAASKPLALGLWDLSPWMSSLTVAQAAVATVPSWMGQQWNAHPVWGGRVNGINWPGHLYWSFRNNLGVSGFMWPMRSWGPSLPAIFATTNTLGYEQWDVGSTDTSKGYDFPVLAHNFMSGDNVLLFHTYTPASGPGPFSVTPRYTVNSVSDTLFPTPVPIVYPTGTYAYVPSAPGAVDILSNVSDPIRPQVFMTSVASNGSGYTPYVTPIQMPDGVVNAPIYTATPSSLQIPVGSTASTYISFTQLGTSSVSTPLPKCSAGGDLGGLAFAVLDPSGAGVTIGLTVPAGLSPNTTYIEGISCSNGVSLTIPVTTSPVCRWAPTTSNILWQSGSQMAAWQMSNDQIGSYVNYPTAPANSVVRATGDFNGDGNGDVLWLNTSTNQVSIWQMTNSSGSVGATINISNDVSGWSILGTGDFNGDLTTDILWQNTSTRQVGIWQMNNGQIGAYLFPTPIPPASWVFQGTGDFNGDGVSDVLWLDTSTNQVNIWQMNGGGQVVNHNITNNVAGWAVLGAGHFNGDFGGQGTTDILWQNTNTPTTTGTWQMSNYVFSILSYYTPPALPSTSWKFRGAGYFNQDQIADVLWQDTSTNQMHIWRMNSSGQWAATVDIPNNVSGWVVDGILTNSTLACSP